MAFIYQINNIDYAFLGLDFLYATYAIKPVFFTMTYLYM